MPGHSEQLRGLAMSPGRSITWLAMGIVLSLTAPGLSSPIETFDPSTLFGQFASQALASAGGNFDAPATHIRYLPDGTTRTSSVPLRDALATVEQMMKEAPVETDNTQATHGFGAGYADPVLSLALEWRFCDVATIYAVYRLDWAPPGSAFAVVEPGAQTPEVIGGQVCGAPATDWADVTLDTRAIGGPARSHCGGAQVLVDYENVAYDRGLLGGVLCGVEVSSAQGKGEVASWVIGLTVVDFFSGSTGLIKMGDEVT